MCALADEIIGDRALETWIGETMRGDGFHRAIATRELVLALRAASTRPSLRESAKSIA